MNRARGEKYFTHIFSLMRPPAVVKCETKVECVESIKSLRERYNNVAQTISFAELSQSGSSLL